VCVLFLILPDLELTLEYSGFFQSQGIFSISARKRFSKNNLQTVDKRV
jgi:hypothetical protein